MAHFPGFELPHFTERNQDRLGRQIASLSRDAAHLSDALARYTTSTGHDLGRMAHDFADEALHQGAAAAQLIGKEARKVGRAVRKDPLPAVMAVTAIACVLSLVLSAPSQRRGRGSQTRR